MLKENYEFCLGDLILTIRKLHGLSQVDYAKSLGVVQSTISKIEKNVFKDVPFSLVSKISHNFNIPIQYFQVGLLPFKKSARIYQLIPKSYLNEGLFKAKTMYYLLKQLEDIYGLQIYKDLKLPAHSLSLSGITYNFEFLNKLYSLTQENLILCIEKLLDQFSSSRSIPAMSVLNHLHNLHGVNLQSNLSQVKNSALLQISFSSDLKKLDHIYAKLLQFELQMVFDAKLTITEEQNNHFLIHSAELVS